MESDSLRSSGDFTVVDMWVEGKLRSISVSRAAIESFLRLPPGASTSEQDRHDFVRTHLAQIVAAAKTQLQSLAPGAETIVIDAAQAEPASDKTATDRRRGSDRRQGDRRKVNKPVARERRSGGDRRKN